MKPATMVRMMRGFVLLLLLSFATGSFSFGSPSGEQGSADRPQRDQVDRKQALRWLASEQKARRNVAVAYFRSKGPDGLKTILSRRKELAPDKDETDHRRNRLNRSIDRVAGQKLGYVSGLYWYRDLDRALERAKRTNKPVLSLRLFGPLDEAFS